MGPHHPDGVHVLLELLGVLPGDVYFVLGHGIGYMYGFAVSVLAVGVYVLENREQEIPVRQGLVLRRRGRDRHQAQAQDQGQQKGYELFLHGFHSPYSHLCVFGKCNIIIPWFSAGRNILPHWAGADTQARPRPLSLGKVPLHRQVGGHQQHEQI